MNSPQIRNLAPGNTLSASFAPSTVIDAIGLAHVASLVTRVMRAHPPKDREARFYELGKRLFDLAVSTCLLVVLAPFFAGIAVLIKATSPGTALFRQDRVGQAGQLFAMYKFRSMFQQAPSYGYSPATGDDPRITGVGRFLRRTNLDEFPQLINVFLGQMSLVGPRPEMPFIVAQYNANQRQRLTVKPGITGLWQISPYRGLPIHEHLEYDSYYLCHRSLVLDAAILLHTFLCAPRGV
jgi:lipopolysaccharide/colanic/teichoic acid biosynthesis glycosyltransferase